MYHRVLPHTEAQEQQEEPGMYVTPETFALHIHCLKEIMTPISLSDWLARRSRGEALPTRAAAITFDDGWRDNYTHAWPMLNKYRIPATIFAVSSLIGTQRAFWPNRLMQLLAQHKGTTNWPPGLEWLAEISPVQPQQLTTPEAFSELVQACKQFPDTELYRRLDAVPENSAIITPARTMLDWDEIAEMRASGLVEIGCHTENHLRLLESLSLETTRHEILASKQALEDRLQQPVNLFCYPNGFVSPLAAEIVSANYAGAVTTERGINRSDNNAFELKRIGLHEDASNTRTAFMARLSGWRK